MSITHRALLCCLLLLLHEHAAGLRWLSPPSRQNAADENSSCKPKQVHIAITGDPTKMRVMWSTDSLGCQSKIHYGRAKDANSLELSSHVYGSVDSYSSNDMCGPPAADYDYDSTALHDVVLTGLKPGKEYTYRFGGRDEVYRFRAAPPVGPQERVKFIMYGDMGVDLKDNKKSKCPGQPEVLAAVAKDVEDNGINLVLHVGDISYADGRQSIWDDFMAAIQPVASRIPYMVAVGNHEYDYHTGKEKAYKKDPSGSDGPYDPSWGNYGNDSGGECGVTISKRFTMPGQDPPDTPGLAQQAQRSNDSELQPQRSDLDSSKLLQPVDTETSEGLQQVTAEPSRQARQLQQGLGHHHGVLPPNSPFWYSFDYGSVHFTFISTEHDLTDGSDQYMWLEQDLSAVDRCVTPFVVLSMHRPMYVVYPHKSNRKVGKHLRKSIERLINDHGVDLVLSGHVHSYYRTCNVYDKKCVDDDEGGAMHVVVGSAGHKLSHIDKMSKQKKWLEYAKEDYGYGRFEVQDGCCLTFQWVRTKDGKVKDEVKLYNRRAKAKGCLSAGSPANATATALRDSSDSSPALLQQNHLQQTEFHAAEFHDDEDDYDDDDDYGGEEEESLLEDDSAETADSDPDSDVAGLQAGGQRLSMQYAGADLSLAAAAALKGALICLSRLTHLLTN